MTMRANSTYPELKDNYVKSSFYSSFFGSATTTIQTVILQYIDVNKNDMFIRAGPTLGYQSFAIGEKKYVGMDFQTNPAYRDFS